MFTVSLGPFLVIFGLLGICIGIGLAKESGRGVINDPHVFIFFAGSIILVAISLVSFIWGLVTLIRV